MKVEKKEELESALNTFKEKITDYEIVTMIARKSSSQGAAEGGQSLNLCLSRILYRRSFYLIARLILY
jgi:hypothetical protein